MDDPHSNSCITPYYAPDRQVESSTIGDVQTSDFTHGEQTRNGVTDLVKGQAVAMTKALGA